MKFLSCMESVTISFGNIMQIHYFLFSLFMCLMNVSCSNPTVMQNGNYPPNSPNPNTQVATGDGQIIVQGSGTTTYRDENGIIKTYERSPNSTTTVSYTHLTLPTNREV